MAYKLLKLWLVFSVFCFLSAVLADYNDGDGEFGDYDDNDNDDDDESCPAVDLPPLLGGTCDVTDHCRKITCTTSVHGQQVTIIFQVNTCEEPVTATVTIKSREADVDWSHTFKDGDEIDIPLQPGYEDQLPPAFRKMAEGAKLWLKVGLKKTGGKLNFKLDLLIETKIRNIQKTILDGEVSLKNQHCGFNNWYAKQQTYMKALVIGGPIAAFLLLIVLVLCCCKSGRRRRVPSSLGVKLPGHRTRGSATRSASMEALINEA